MEFRKKTFLKLCNNFHSFARLLATQCKNQSKNKQKHQLVRVFVFDLLYNISMSQKPFLVSYLAWHYSHAFVEIWNTCTNYIWAVWHFFSVPILLQTFFAPWHKMDIEYGKGFDIENFIGPFIVNTLMRLVGMVMRTVIILIGLFLIVLLFLLGIVATVVWFVLPVVLLWLFWQGFSKLK